MTLPSDWSKLRTEFPTLDRKIYLNSCSLGLLSKRTRGAMERFVELWASYGAAAWYSEWLSEIDYARQEFATLIGASPDEVAILPNVSSALTAISSSLNLSEGDQIVSTDLDFPTLGHHFLAKKSTGVETAIISSEDRVKVDLEQFEAFIDDRSVLVATSRVFFTSGYIQDIAAVAEIAHRHGSLVFIDDYQGAGQVPIDVKKSEVDVLVSGGLKWLMGGPGIAYMYVNGELFDSLTPTVTGWFGNRNQFDFNPNEMVFRENAAKFENGTPSVAAIYAGAEGLRMVNEIGASAIRERTSELTQHLTARLREKGFQLRTPEDPEQHASITMVEVDDPKAAVRYLGDRDIIVDHRPGAVRVSPYFYNTLEDIDNLVETLDDTRN